MQSTDGSSKPSVSTAQLATTRDGPAGRERRRPIECLGGDTSLTKGVSHGIGESDRGGKKERLALRRMGLKGGEDLRRGVGRKEQGLELGTDKIALLGPQRIEVGLEQDLEGAQVDEIAGLHHLQQGFLIH